MLKILIPLAGKSIFFNEKEYVFPKPLLDIQGKPMIELVINNLEKILTEKEFIFLLRSEDCIRYHLDDTIRLITNPCTIIKIDRETKGAACSALLAIDHINNTDNLVIANGDQLFEEDLNQVLGKFHADNCDAAVICFESVHPRWSYVSLDENNRIIETAEKRPISKNAIAGFYYFKHGKDFVRAAMKSIKNDYSVNGLYYIAPVLNELVLENKMLSIYRIDNNKYFTFYSPAAIKHFERHAGLADFNLGYSAPYGLELAETA